MLWHLDNFGPQQDGNRFRVKTPDVANHDHFERINIFAGRPPAISV